LDKFIILQVPVFLSIPGDVMRCPSCKKEIPEWARDSCPECGEIIMKKKSAVLPWIGLGLIIAIVVIIFLIPPPPPPCTSPGCGVVTPVPAITPRPAPCPDPIAITAIRQGRSNIIVTNRGGAGNSCVTNFTILVNGVANPQALGPDAGSMVSVQAAGTTGKDSVVVVGNYKNGAQQVVLQKSL